MPRVSVEGMRFYYQQAGEGQDVVLLHGVTGNMAVWPLINMLPTLAADFRVTAYDLRGHGYSETPPSGYTSADMAGDLVKIQQALGLGPMYVLGHSYGGVIALHAAVLYPEAIAGLILSDPYFPGLRHLETSLSAWSGWQEYKEQAGRAGLQVSEEDWFDVGQLFAQTANLPPERHEMFRKELGLAAMDRLTRLAATTCGDDVKAVAGLTAERISSVRHPTIALYGEHSPFLATCRYLEANLANCRVALVPDAKHRAHEENPAAYVALVQQLLRELRFAERAGYTGGAA
ncbi:MAG TPA: alpha/beta hydrolase [Gemmataceae bacterium]|nr:alpha/beta hydrolase [Gemmataceae bacterium]